VTAENGKLDKVPTRRFLKLPIPAEPMNSVLAVLAGAPQTQSG
jgi:hypothetical protein